MLKPFKILTEEELNRIELISKSKNAPNRPVYREELPSILFGRAPRILLGKTWFDRYTSGLDKVAACQSCGKSLFGGGERHENYGLYLINLEGVNEYLIKLESVMKICSKCHKAIHNGFSTKLGVKYGFLPEQTPKSGALSKGPWERAKYILVDNNLYLIK